MATQFITSPQTPDGYTIGAGSTDSYIFDQNATVYHDDGHGILISNGALTSTNVAIHSIVVGGEDGGFDSYAGVRADGEDSIYISQTGAVYGDDIDGYGVSLTGSENNVVIDGSAAGYVGVLASGGGGHFVSANGSVIGDLAGLVMQFGNDNVVNVSGSVTSAGFGVLFLAADNASLTNSGTIYGGGSGGLFGDSSAAVWYDSGLGGVGTLVNTGTITAAVNPITGENIAVADASYDLGFPDASISGDLTFTNSGLVDGDIVFGAGDDSYYGQNGVMTAGSSAYLGDDDDEFFGGAGREVVYDGMGNDTVITGGGRDFMRTEGGADYFDGGSGRDFLTYRDTGPAVRINLNTDSQAGGAVGNEAADDTIVNIESIGGTNGGHDVLIGDEVNNSLYGYNGNDRLYGADGNDRLLGGNGKDFFDGGNGDDLLIGGNGEDRFQLDRGDGNDTVQDFQNNVDTLEFDNFGYIANVADLLSATYTSEVGSDVLFDFGTDGSMLVLNTSIAEVTNDVALV